MNTWGWHREEAAGAKPHRLRTPPMPPAYPRVAVNIFKVAEARHAPAGPCPLFGSAALCLLLGWLGLLLTEVDVVGNLAGVQCEGWDSPKASRPAPRLPHHSTFLKRTLRFPWPSCESWGKAS